MKHDRSHVIGERNDPMGDENRCPAYYDETKQCVLVNGHGGEHYTEWRAAMWFPCDRNCLD